MARTPRRLALAALAAGAVIALPAHAAAAPAPSTFADVNAIVNKADAALDRAEAHLARDRHNPSLSSLRRARVEMGRAQAATNRMVSRAQTNLARTHAARSAQVVAELREENLRRLVRMLNASDARGDRLITRAILADTAARDTAIGVLQGLVDQGINARARERVTAAIATLSQGRAREVTQQANALARLSMPPVAERTLARAIQTNMTGQAQAAVVITALLPQLPEDAREEMQRALEQLNQQLKVAAQRVDAVIAQLPPAVQELVRTIVDQALALAADPLGVLAPAPAAPPAPAGSEAPAPAPVPAVPDLNALMPDLNALLPPALQGLIPDLNALIPDIDALIPDLNALVPGAGGTTPGLPIPNIGGLIGGILGGVLGNLPLLAPPR